jgi:hypothetical protein
MCQHVHGPIVLHNPSRREFEAVAYSSKPLLVKGAASRSDDVIAIFTQENVSLIDHS